ncbi:UNVERIFIED_CONTAM: hypothetical protein Sradi_6846800 [Sesamum radiatum]|uniref:RNase H type-1 domain-containing protein n=1 Tax=Sesamum radiatum TaxID=300843 RepID=A0AAW2JKY7_SESRA
MTCSRSEVCTTLRALLKTFPLRVTVVPLRRLGGSGFGRRSSLIKLRCSCGGLAWMLSLRASMKRRTSGCLSVCPLCFEDGEDILHILASCSYARQVWALVPLSVDLSLGRKEGVFSWLWAVSAGLDARVFGLFLCVFWAVWWFRNRKMMEGESSEPLQVASFAVQFLEAYLRQAAASSSQALPHTLSPWQMGLGIVALDATGSCLAWMSIRLHRAANGEMAEAWAAWEAVILVQRSGWRSVVLEGDCLMLCQKLTAGVRDFSPLALLSLIFLA